MMVDYHAIGAPGFEILEEEYSVQNKKVIVGVRSRSQAPLSQEWSIVRLTYYEKVIWLQYAYILDLPLLL